jgi:molybdopterin-guanine dinucleotide biosynthesis protein A
VAPDGFSGAILTGGRSARMGVDKATLAVRGRPLVTYPRDALRSAGAREVLAVGGDREALAALGLTVVADEHPGEGPLGGIVTALRVATEPVVVVLACDLPAITCEVVRRLVDAVGPGVDAAVPVRDGRLEVVAAAYRRRALPRLERAFAAGGRSPSQVISRLTVRELRDLPRGALVDLDRPCEARRYDAGDG